MYLIPKISKICVNFLQEGQASYIEKAHRLQSTTQNITFGSRKILDLLDQIRIVGFKPNNEKILLITPDWRHKLKVTSTFFESSE